MLKRGQHAISHQVLNIAECVLSFSPNLREEEEFPSEALLSELLHDVKRRRVVAVVGDVGVGKSSVLNLLTETNVFTSYGDDLPLLARKWIYGKHMEETPQEGVDVKYLPCEFLQGIDLLDMNGVLDSPNLSIKLMSLLNRVDVIVFVVDARHADDGVSWQLLGNMPNEAYSRMVMAVTHEDLFDYEAQQEIKAKVRERCEKHFGMEVPLFMVRGGGQLSRQGGEALARRINSIIDMAAIHSNLEERVLTVTRSLMDEQKHVLHNQDRLSRLDAGFLSNIEHEIDHLQDKITAVLGHRLEAIGKFVQNCVPALSKKSSRKLGYYLSIGNLSRMGRMSMHMDYWFYEHLRKGVEEQQEHHNKEFLNACERHWSHLRPLVKDQLDCEIGDFPGEHIRARLNGYRRSLGRSLYKPLVDFGLKPCLSKLYATQRGWMKKQLIVIFLLIIFAGLIGGLRENTAGLILLGIAGFLWGVSVLILWVVRIRLTSQITAAAKDMHIAVCSGIEGPLYVSTMSGVADYRKLFTNIRGYVAINANQLAPLMARHNQLFYQLSAMSRRG